MDTANNKNAGQAPDTAQLTPPKKKKPILKYFLIFLLLDASAAGYWYFLSPQAQVKKVVRQMAEAFAVEDLNGLVSHISPQYTDPAGNTRDDLSNTLEIFFRLCDDPSARDDRVIVQIKDGVATVAVTGRIMYKFRGTLQRTKYNKDNPFIITMSREDGEWKVLSMPSVYEPLSSAEAAEREISNF